MKALVLSEIFPPRIGGSGRWLHEIYSRQPRDRAVMLVGEWPGAEEFDRDSDLVIDRTPLTGRHWTLMNLAGMCYMARMARAALKAGRAHKADQIHVARVMPEGVAALAASRLGSMDLVCFLHGEDMTLAAEGRESRLLVSAVIRGAARIVCNSENTRQILERDGWVHDPSRVRVLHPGVDTTLYRPAAEHAAAGADPTSSGPDPILANAWRRDVRTRFGWNAEGPLLLTVSRLEKRKGHDIMIEALPSIVQRIPDLQYAIVGDGEEREALARRVNELGLEANVLFNGSLDDDELVAAYAAADLFALPNRQVGTSVEGFGIVLLEAQASGCAVIAGASGGTAETLVDGETGLVLDCTNPAPLADAVSDLFLDPYRLRRMGDAARRHVVARFDWQALGRQATEAVFFESYDR